MLGEEPAEGGCLPCPGCARSCDAGRPGCSSWSKSTIVAEWIGEPTVLRPRAVRTSTSWIPWAFSAVTAPRACRAEADHHRSQPAAVVPGRPDQLQGVQHRAVAGQLVVLVEDVQAERTVAPGQWFIASKAIMVSRRSMASWVSSVSCTQCGQPHST